jgi:hypothetical protein
MLSVVVARIGVESIFYSVTNYATIFYAQFVSDQTHYFQEISMSTRKVRTAFYKSKTDSDFIWTCKIFVQNW